MALKFKGGGSLIIRNAQKSDFNAEAVIIPRSIRVSGGTASPQTIDDANLLVYSGATYYTGGKLQVSGLGSQSCCGVENLTPSIATVAADGEITRLNPGLLKLSVGNGQIKLPVELNMLNYQAVDQPNEFVSTVVGSMAEHCQQQIDGRINNTMNMAANGLIFTTQQHSTPYYARNPNLWCADVDLTCISPWNSYERNYRAGTLITPRHVLGAAHYEVAVGTTMRFIGNDNSIHDRVITGKKRAPNFVPVWPDLTVYTLASDLPTAITPCKVMPTNYSNYLRNSYFNRPPAMGLDQEEKALIIDYNNNQADVLNQGGNFMIPVDPTRLIFHEDKIGGDSGNPAFLIVSDELILITVWTYGGAGGGTPVAQFIPTLNQMIVDADTQAGVSSVDNVAWPNSGGHYQLKQADFSDFPDYS